VNIKELEISYEETKNPLEVVKKLEKIFEPLPEGVTLDYVNTGGWFNSRFGGVIIKTTDSRYHTVQRRVMLKNNKINLDAVKKKIDELAQIHKQAQKIIEERRKRDKARYEKMKALEEELNIDYPISVSYTYSCSDDKFDLKLRGLTEDELRKIIQFYREIKGEK